MKSLGSDLGLDRLPFADDHIEPEGRAAHPRAEAFLLHVPRETVCTTAHAILRMLCFKPFNCTLGNLVRTLLLNLQRRVHHL